MQAQDVRVFVSPGAKFGHTFGANSGLTSGVELSATRFAREIAGPYIGVTLSTDSFNKERRVHIGIEGGVGPIGISFGPTWFLKEKSSPVGWTVTNYIGFFLIPYHSLVSTPDGQLLYEVGAFLKFPIQIAGSKLSLH